MTKSFAAAFGLGLILSFSAHAQTIASDIPAAFVPVNGSFDYVRREVDIPMRDGVKLHTVLIIPRGATHTAIILNRTPYSAKSATHFVESSHGDRTVAPAFGLLFRAGYILVFEDIRGKFGSGGVFVNERPLMGPDNPSGVDESTDAWDTIDWLVKNVQQCNGRVAMIGSSYDGMTVAMALVHPHPALKAAVAANPVINTWMGDDDFHGGALRMINFDYYYSEESTREDAGELWRGSYDEYETFLQAGTAGNFVRQWGLDQLPAVRRLRDHQAYDPYWQAQALETILPRYPQTVPTLWVASQWDQEDIYGAVAVFEAVHPHDPRGVDHLVMGPWRHEGWMDDGSSLGPIRFDSNTALWFRTTVLLPFLNQHLRDGPDANLPTVLTFQTGTNRWQRLDAWPQSCRAGCPFSSSTFYLLPDGGLGPHPPAVGSKSDSYVSDPEKPIPYRIRPILASGARGSTWERWLVDDQRPFSDRPDVLVYETPPLTQPVAIAGAPVASLAASTTGTDGDFVVKLIDVYPDECTDEPTLGGYQLPLAMDILRGRYRVSFSKPMPIEPGAVLRYRFVLPNVDHVFLPGHRIMVQIQSTWFPLYDRNPQTFVPDIFDAKPADYVKATIRIFHSSDAASFVELPTVAGHWGDSAAPR